MSHSTAFTPAIVSWGRRSVKIMTILVTGATGNIGRRIVDHLIDLGANDIRALTTNPAKAKLPDGVTPGHRIPRQTRIAPAALAGVDRMYLAPLPETLDVTLEMAKAANVSYVVALSGGSHWQRHADTITASGLTNTQLGPGEFLENFAIWSDQIKATPHGPGAVSDQPWRRRSRWTISRGWPQRCWSSLSSRITAGCTRLTGPESLTARRDRRADRSRDRRGRHLRAVQPRRGRGGTATDHWCDAAWYLDVMASGVDTPQQANQLVAKLTGVPAQSVAQWASANAALFR